MICSKGSIMTNEEHQRQAERSDPIEELRREQGIEDFNRPEGERQASAADAEKKASLKSLGSQELSPPILGPGVDGPGMDESGVDEPIDRRVPQDYQAQQITYDGMQPGTVISGDFAAPGARSSLGGKFVSGALALIMIVIVLFHFESKKSTSLHSPVTSNAPSPKVTPSSPQPKPSPYRSASEVANPNSAAKPTDIVAPVSPAQIASDVPVSTPGQTVQVSTPSVAPRSFHAARKGVRNGCAAGALTFTASRIDFSCPNDPSKGVSIIRGKVKKIDNDGVQLLTNDKYHFKIPGNTSEQVKQLFSSWLNGPLPVGEATSGPAQTSR
jgi:hypothetical protein